MFKKFLMIIAMTTALSFFAFTLAGYVSANDPASRGAITWESGVTWQ